MSNDREALLLSAADASTILTQLIQDQLNAIKDSTGQPISYEQLDRLLITNDQMMSTLWGLSCHLMDELELADGRRRAEKST